MGRWMDRFGGVNGLSFLDQGGGWWAEGGRIAGEVKVR